MPRPSLWLPLGPVALMAVLAGAGCSLFAPRPVEPPREERAAREAGAVKLALELFKGCEILASGDPVARGAARIPYPAQCANPRSLSLDPVAPTAKMQLLTGTPYYLNQLTLMDKVIGQHTDLKNPGPAAEWMKTQSLFKGLDWSGLHVTGDDWTTFAEPMWLREVSYGDAAWMKVRDDSFKVEVLDSEGGVHATATYAHGSFWGESPAAGHTRVAWKMWPVAPPKAPGQLEKVPGMEPQYHTMVRIDLVGYVDPTNTFKVVGLKGDGALRVTWSQLPDQPFYFPVTYVDPADVPATCFGGPNGDRPTPCGLGLEPRIQLSAPKGGKGYYQPGESFDVFLSLEDEAGNRLQSPEGFPSYNQFLKNAANGLLYYPNGYHENLLEQDINPCFKIEGPLQQMTPPQTPYAPARAYWESPPWRGPGPSEGEFTLGIAAENFLPGLRDIIWPTRVPVTLPADAKPGTYVMLLKVGRQFMGERVARGRTVTFQVGQAEPTGYPGQVGGCERCHVGAVALDNVRHGFPVEHIEACTGCHSNVIANWPISVHRIHGGSEKYPLAKNDCSVCHLKRESAVRPTWAVCSTCHANAHHGELLTTQFSVTGRFDTCAQGCHVDKLPKGHILPEP